ncbi:MAG: histidinol-phosphatase [Anaerolineae bacterium]|nr:histidinol-phosphatase [Anaerolineae bacterium]
MITVDYHTHNIRCGHAQGQIEDYIRAAIRLGLTDIGVSDHNPAYWLPGDDPMPTVSMAKSELEGYVDETLRLKAKYAGQINVRLGLECDYVEGMEDACREMLARHPFDYVIGSVHWVQDANIFHVRRWDGVTDALPIFAEYYRLIIKSAQSGLFDIVGHSTAMTAFAPKPLADGIEALQDEALAAINDAGLVMEVNTSGFRKMTTEPFPTFRMIAAAHRLGIPLTFSSDSHRPEDVGYARDRIAAYFAQIGLGGLATFAGRQRIMLPLHEAASEPAMAAAAD